MEQTSMPTSLAGDGPERRPVDIMTTELRYRVRGPLSPDTAENAESGTVFVRTSFDHRSRAFLEVIDEGYVVRFEAFKRAWWQWAEDVDVRREFGAGEGALAGRYFNSLALSPGYRGPVNLELERDRD
jgi:hypothetical protein